MKKIKKYSNHRRGTTAVEFALVAPLFFLLIFGLFECLRFVMIKQAVTNAAREGARTSILATTNEANDVDEKVRYYLNSVVRNSSDPDMVQVTISPEGDPSSFPSQTAVTTTVRINYSETSWLPRWFLDGVVIEGTSTMERN